MKKLDETKVVSKEQQENKARQEGQNRFTDKERKNKEAKKQKLGGF